MGAKKYLIIYFLVCFCLFFAGCQNNQHFFSVTESAPISRLGAHASTVELAHNVAPAIVGVVSKLRDSSSIGSGVCIKSGGYVLTNHHVISNMGKITLHLHNGEIANAIVIYSDIFLDVALLKSDYAIPYLPLGDSENLNVGEDVVAVGTPLSLTFKHTFTKGIVSALNRTLQVTNEQNEVGIMNNLIQHDASINPGNSGGPLINSAGEVIGINTLKISGAEGMGFAIPIKAVKSIIEKCKTGNVSTPLLGVAGFDANIKNVGSSGFYVCSVKEFSPAYECGIKKGDIITKINGNSVANGAGFRYELNKYDAGDHVVIEYVTKGNIKRGLIKFARSVQKL